MTRDGACDVCGQGSYEERLVETCMRSGQAWVVFRNVPALVCDVCEETLFDEAVSQELARLLNPSSGETPTGVTQARVYDLKVMERARAEGRRPIIIATIPAMPALGATDLILNLTTSGGSTESTLLIRDGTKV